MAKLEEKKEETKRFEPVEGVTKSDRTKVIILSQIVTIVALIVLWSVLRGRRTST
ncbi:MAG: hypothetical protein OEZ14_17445 [Acidimicrobiia bacterium]|nr:hypothetical protein [Acidimicrobiia bacterium]MDH4308974.1 hypothetical protein [Acidimicrobiia bacterium]MDH5522308.1 hypothetical protein [Acidimicrobiia bacterium]